MKFASLVAIGSLLAVFPAGASTMLHTVNAQLYRDEAALYPSVGKAFGSGLIGSGVMISDRWVLTAGHIAQGKGAGDTYNVGGVDYVIQSSTLHPNFTTSSGSYAYDLGLLYLSAAVTGITPAAMLRLDPATSIIGKEATYVGTGFTGTGQTGAQSSDIERRAFTNKIEFYGEQYELTNTSFVSDFDDPDGLFNRQQSERAATRLEGAVAPGDSGGGVFITENGVRYLIGINSYSGYVSLATSNSKYGGLSGAVDLQQFHSWISSTTGITAVPEPSVFLVGVLGGLLGLRRRR
jgi:Trypsin